MGEAIRRFSLFREVCLAQRYRWLQSVVSCQRVLQSLRREALETTVGVRGPAENFGRPHACNHQLWSWSWS